MAYSHNVVHEIWNDATGEKLTVGPDGDGLDLIEIRSYTDDGIIASRLTITPEQAPLLADALNKYVSSLGTDK